jgi:hypothetical protein
MDFEKNSRNNIFRKKPKHRMFVLHPNTNNLCCTMAQGYSKCFVSVEGGFWLFFQKNGIFYEIKGMGTIIPPQ